MINFILCDDNERDMNKLVKFIDDFMMGNDYEYNKHIFADYDDEFLYLISKKMPGKIYILDIETPTRSGIDIARVIRNRDDNSILIFLTGHEELGQVVLKKDFAFLAFINKFDECETRLNETLTKAIKHLNKKINVRFKDNGNIIRLTYDDILYITRDSVERKTIIKTDFNEFKLGVSLSKVKKLLNSDFVQTHRSCIVNKTRVMEFCKNSKLIVFDNGSKIDLVTSRFNKELI